MPCEPFFGFQPRSTANRFNPAAMFGQISENCTPGTAVLIAPNSPRTLAAALGLGSSVS